MSKLASIGLAAAAAFALPIAPSPGLAQDSSRGFDLSGFAYIESNKTFSTGRILAEGPYLNAIAVGQYSHGDDRFTVAGIFGTHLDGEEAGELNKANLNACAARTEGRFTAQICTTHYFNPTGDPFDDLYALFAHERFGVQVGDVNLEHDGPYVELFARGRRGVGTCCKLTWRLTAAASFDPEVPYGSAAIELRTGPRMFWNVHVYHQEGYDTPDITLRAGLSL